MAQIVILAPTGEDVSAGEQALKDAGHEVEVVEATAANLLHMAIGMVEDEEHPEDKPLEEPPAEDEQLPAETTDTTPPAEEPPVGESLGYTTVDGEKVNAYLDTSLRFPLLRVMELAGSSKVSYKLNESVFSQWPEGGFATVTIDSLSTQVRLGAAKTRAHILLDPATAKSLKLA
jgi:hypothetical protein